MPADARQSAIEHCRRAVAILEEIGDLGALCKVQAAIDEMSGAAIPRTVAEAETLLDTPEARGIAARIRL